MVGGQQSARNIQHLSELFRLADAAGLLQDPGLACRRMKQLLVGAWNLESSAKDSGWRSEGSIWLPWMESILKK